MPLKIFIIAGEASGDRLGAKLIKTLKQLSENSIEFAGIGGQLMKQEGLNSLFPVSKISLMGFAEIIPHIFTVRKLIKYTVNKANIFKPDIVITIDSPGFCFRVIKNIKRTKNSKFVHYISPSVWAYKEKRVNFISKYYDLILSVLPFEAKYYKNLPIEYQYIGHPLTEDGWSAKNNKDKTKELHNISTSSKILGVMAGSRKNEIHTLLPIFVDSINRFLESNKKITVIFPAISKEISRLIKLYVKKINCPTKVINVFELNTKQRIELIKSFDAALVKSGTSSLELTFAKIPMIVAYKMHPMSYLILKYYFKILKNIKFASLTNIILEKEVIPEYIQDNCTVEKISNSIKHLFNKSFAKKQTTEYLKVIQMLSNKDKMLPSTKAALAILGLHPREKLLTSNTHTANLNKN